MYFQLKYTTVFDIDKILTIENNRFTKLDLELIRKAYHFSKDIHEGQKRLSGESYFEHCFETALKVASWNLESTVIAAAFLHESIENTDISIDYIEKEFGEEVAFLVKGVDKLGYFKYREKESKQEDKTIDNFRKMFLAISEDVRIIFIRLADRFHNMKTLKVLPKDKQKRIALETSKIYAPLANQLGMSKLSSDFEDLTLPYIYQEKYKWLLENMPEKYGAQEDYLKRVKLKIEDILLKNNISPKITFRVKRYSSILKKMNKDIYDSLDKIYDLVALRIIVPTIVDCYKSLGLIHKEWVPLPEYTKDYIDFPKSNGYQSLHTTVYCLDNKVTEIQIRTPEMHQEAEYGIAAHWMYDIKKDTKEYKKGKGSKKKSEDLGRIDFLRGRIFAMTPAGDIIDLPIDSTPVDFAYRIHGQVGDQCVSAKVNKKLVPLDYKLKSGDMVEIKVQKGKKPSKSWLDFVKTSTAIGYIRKSIRKEKRNIVKKDI